MRGISFSNDRIQLFVVRRATDVLKAVALGATAGANYFFSKLIIVSK
jgi:hypothetical protein